MAQPASRAERTVPETWTRRIAVLRRRLRETITASHHIRSAEVITTGPLSELRLAVHCRLTATGDREAAHREIAETHIPASQRQLGLVFAGIEVTFADDAGRSVPSAPVPADEPLRGGPAMGLSPSIQL